MAGNEYAECLVKRKRSGGGRAVQAVLILGIVLAAVSTLIVGLLGFGAFVLMCLTAFYVTGRMNMEYEYLFAEGQFSVDCIYDRSRRKQAAEYSLEEIECICPAEGGSIREFEARIKRVSDFSSGRLGAERYALVVRRKGLCEKVIIEPDERMLKCLKNAAPRKFSRI